jgi:predicted nucleic acid-binding protein
VLVLDTNHVSELTYRTAAGLRLIQKLDVTNEDAAVTAINVEESLRGWLAEIRRRTDPRTQIAAYQRLIRQVEVFASWLLLPWDEDAANHFDSLKLLRQQVGT